MKIICSDGPKVGKADILGKLYKAGMDIIRFNFSHADYTTTEQLITYSREHCPNLEILQDLQGVKIRVSTQFNREIKVLPNQQVDFCAEDVYDHVRFDWPNPLLIPVHFDGDFSLLISAKKMLMKDATMEFQVVESQEKFIRTTVTRGGVIRARKALNAPGMDRSQLSLTAKDKHDALWGIEHSVDIICLSFVSFSSQIKDLKDFIKKETKNTRGKMPEIWAKIETKEGVENFNSILRSVDGIMLGRGDLGPEVGIYEVPEIQEFLLKKMKTSKKEFIIATQVLESMTRSPVPNRAELNDIYSCIKNNATGFMLTAETGIGHYPTLAIDTLRKMIDKYSRK
jgi:pyruvate kinase